MTLLYVTFWDLSRANLGLDKIGWGCYTTIDREAEEGRRDRHPKNRTDVLYSRTLLF